MEEGFNTYDADGNLQKTVEDREVEKEEYDQISDALVDGTIFEVKLENGVYAFVIDGNNERTYELKVAGSGDYESWNLFINL